MIKFRTVSSDVVRFRFIYFFYFCSLFIVSRVLSWTALVIYVDVYLSSSVERNILHWKLYFVQLQQFSLFVSLQDNHVSAVCKLMTNDNVTFFSAIDWHLFEERKKVLIHVQMPRNHLNFRTKKKTANAIVFVLRYNDSC